MKKKYKKENIQNSGMKVIMNKYKNVKEYKISKREYKNIFSL